MHSRSPGTAVIHTISVSPSVCTHDEAVSVSVSSVLLFVEYANCIGSCLKRSLHILERDGSEGNRADVILYFGGRFLWYRDDGSCLPKKRDMASVQGLLKKHQ